MMVDVVETIGRGLGLGSVYALLGLGFVIIFKATRVISFAQPALLLAGVVVMTYLTDRLGFWAALGVSVLGAAAIGLGIERSVIRPMIGRPVFVVAVMTVGLDVAIRVIATAILGLDVRQVGDPWGLRTVDIGPVRVEQRDLAVFTAMLLIAVTLYGFFQYTRWGLAMRAAALDQETALIQGVPVGTVFAVSWAMAAGLAALAGTFHAAGNDVDASIWLVALVALPVIILGGLDSLPGAVIGGLLVGVAQEATATYQDAMPWLGDNVAPVVPYALMLVVLLLRPYGLFGTREVERV